MKVQAVGDRLFIRLLQDKQAPESKIIMVSDLGEEKIFGEVISAGEKVRSVKPGDKVFFHVFDELEGPEDNVVVVRESSVLGVLCNE